MERAQRISSVVARSPARASQQDEQLIAETAARKAEAAAHFSAASRLLGYHPDEIELARRMLPLALLNHEIEGWLPSHIVVRMAKRIESLAGMAAFADALERNPDLKKQLRLREREHSNRMKEVAAKSPHAGSRGAKLTAYRERKKGP